MDVSDPTTGSNNDSSFIGEVISDATKTASQVVSGYESQQTTLKLATISSSTVIMVAIVVAAILIIPAVMSGMEK